MIKTNFSRTKAALVEYDSGAEERERVWNAAMTMPAFRKAEQIAHDALLKVREAYADDTHAFNDRNTVMQHVDIQFMRKMAQ